jgi:hypothetical protein
MRIRYRNRDHLVATIAKLIAGGIGVLAAMLFLRSLPDLARYVKIERM